MTTKMIRRTFLKAGASLSFSLITFCSLKNRFDVIIKNGLVVDGIGSPPIQKDIGIIRNKIAAIDNLNGVTADEIIDATNLIIAPGFIDIHSHTDIELIVNFRAESKIRQGVTTEVSGNCGSSPFPLNDADSREYDKQIFEQYGIHPKWHNINQFLEVLEEHKIAINYATLTGHGDLRSNVIGRNDIPATSEQLRKMQAILAETLQNGSFGLSTGLEYSPGSYASTDELIALCQIVAKYRAIHASHIRNEDDRLEEAVEEALKISEVTGASLEIAHLKACNQANWPKIEKVLTRLHQAAEQGIAVNADRYPYIAYGTGLSAFLPLWARQGNTEDIIARLTNPKDLPEIEKYISGRGERIGGWDRVQISSCSKPENKNLEGKSILEAANKRDLAPFEFIRQLLVDEKLQPGIVGFAMCEENLKKVLSDPLVMIGSDGRAVAPYDKTRSGKPHPRFYGTFPRVLGKYCRDEKYFDLATAIKKMTSMPAKKLGLRQRGQIFKGYYADLVIFNPGKIIDRATFINPHQYPIGVDYVIVNGRIAIKKGEHTGVTAGQVLRKQS